MRRSAKSSRDPLVSVNVTIGTSSTSIGFTTQPAAPGTILSAFSLSFRTSFT